MLVRLRRMLTLIVFTAIASLSPDLALAQNSVSEFYNILRQKVAFNESDLTHLGQGQPVVRLLPVTDKREVAVCGLVNVQVPAQVFLQSFRESITRKSNPAILQIGRFSDTPTAFDLESLTFEESDLEDLKECVVGDCKLKLSARMIERLHEEVDWNALDYRTQATQLLKQMLLDYVRDYLVRGDVALIEYNDKPTPVHLAEEQGALVTGSASIDSEFQRHLNDSRKSEFSMVESAIVWSKIKFGLKPVIAINHIIIYKRAKEIGPQVFVTSKQIYANHYFDSSIALTTFLNIPGEIPQSYLLYENRSRADGLGGLFGRMKRGIVEDKAMDNLKNILESSKRNLDGHTLARTESASPGEKQTSSRGWKFRRVHIFFSLLLVTALITLSAVGKYCWRSSLSGGVAH